MASLQNKTIASQRKIMLEGGMKAVFKQLFSFKEIPDIQLDDHSYHQMAVKDIIAFTLVHSALCDGGKIFGGFLCSIYSGTFYNDIDILFSKDNQKSYFCERIFNIMENILGLSFEEYDITEKPKSYATSFIISATIEGVTSKLEVDVVCSNAVCMDRGRCIYHPLTWGRTLQYGKEGISFRNVGQTKKYCKKPSLKHVENFLSEQKDILNKQFLVYTQNEQERVSYTTYIDSKLKNLKKEGYEVVNS